MVSYSILILPRKVIEHILLCFVCIFSCILTLEYACFFHRPYSFKNCSILFILCIFFQSMHPPKKQKNKFHNNY